MKRAHFTQTCIVNCLPLRVDLLSPVRECQTQMSWVGVRLSRSEFHIHCPCGGFEASSHSCRISERNFKSKATLESYSC